MTGENERWDEVICYCFQFTALDIRNDVIENGRSLIMEHITAQKSAGRCDCAAKNPKGR